MKLLSLFMILLSTSAFATCRVPGSVAPRSIHRGMYVSLRASNIGQMPLHAPLLNILGNKSEENALLSFIVKYQFDSLSLYDLHTILQNPTLTTRLSRLIQAAKACGVTEVNAIGATTSDWPSYLSYQKANAGKFNGMVTEIEFWNGDTTFPDFISELKYIKTVGITDQHGPVSVTPYIGWLNRIPGITEGQAGAQIADNTDRVFVHAYVKNPVSAYGYTQSRVNALLAEKPSLPIWPIFSAEGQAYSAGSDKFMGDWLSANSLDAAEAVYSNSYKPVGFQYYEYSFLLMYLK